jgi:hypothetical protein
MMTITLEFTKTVPRWAGGLVGKTGRHHSSMDWVRRDGDYGNVWSPASLWRSVGCRV